MGKRIQEYQVTIMLAAAILAVGTFDVFLWQRILQKQMAKSEAQASDANPSASVASVPPAVEPVPAPADIEAQEHFGEPVRISIPSINVDAAVEKVTLAKDGSLAVPSHPHDAAWYSLGPRPGQIGSATIDGHMNWLNGTTAVFADLRKVAGGDVVKVTDDAGKVISFVVRESRQYDHAANAVDVFTSSDGKAHLNLITCDGSWDARAKQYSRRLVVFAEKMGE
jgi:sortase (surface protein transpeptidase)